MGGWREAGFPDASESVVLGTGGRGLKPSKNWRSFGWFLRPGVRAVAGGLRDDFCSSTGGGLVDGWWKIIGVASRPLEGMELHELEGEHAPGAR